MFRVLSDIYLGPGSVRIIPITQNTTKQNPFGICAGSLRFICAALDSTMMLAGQNTLHETFFFLDITLHGTYYQILSVKEDMTKSATAIDPPSFTLTQTS